MLSLPGDDLDSVSNKVYDKMAELDPSGESSNVVDMLLGMHLLEDELVSIMALYTPVHVTRS